MTFIQHQKFLLAYKKYCPSFYQTTPYYKFYSKHFHISNFILRSFQFSIKGNSILNVPPRRPLKMKTRPSFVKLNKDTRQNFQASVLKWLKYKHIPVFFIKNTGILNCSATPVYIKKRVCASAFQAYDQKYLYQFNLTIQNLIIPLKETHLNIRLKRQRLIRNSLKGILLVNFPEKEKNFLIKNLAAENKIALITQSASLLLKDSRNMDDLLDVDDPIQILFDKVKNCIPCICFINNLDRIGKQRYEQQQNSLYGIHHSLSLLIHNRSKDHRVSVSEPMNEKSLFTLPTSVLSNKTKTFRFDYDLKKMGILKIFQTSRFKASNIEDRCNFSLENLTKTTRFSTPKKKWLKDFNAVSLTFPWTEAERNKDAPVFVNNPYMVYTEAMFNKKIKLYSNHRLPFWLFTNNSPTIPVFFEHEDDKGHKIDIADSCLRTDHLFSINNQFLNKNREGLYLNNFRYKHSAKIKFFNSLYYLKKEKTRFESVKSRINFLPLQIAFSQSLASKINSTLEKPQYKIVNPKTRFKNPNTILKNSFLKSNNNEIFENKLKNFSTNRYYPTSAKKKLSFQDLGNLSLHKTKISLMFSDLSWQTIKNNFQAPPVVSYHAKRWEGTQKQRTSDFLSPSFKYPSGPETGKKSGYLLKDGQINSNEREGNKNDRFKITETEMIKRTALLKFLQILDGFHTTTRNRKQIFFSNLSIFGLKTKIKDASMFKILFQQEYSKFVIRPLFKYLLEPDTGKKTSRSHVGQKRVKHGGWLNHEPKKLYMSKLFLALPKKNIQVPPIVSEGCKQLQAKLLNETTPSKSFKSNFDGKNSLPIKNFLDYVSQKKTRSPISFINSGYKWQIYLKNQPSLKSLNLLCVWPSYSEEILGSFNSNDGASYLLPEYFQLLGHGPKLKKQGITLIASTNNLTTLDAALLRPGRFDTIINFYHSFLSIDKFDALLKHSPSLIQDNKFSLRFNSKRENQLIFEKSLPFLRLESNPFWVRGLQKRDDFVFSKNSFPPDLEAKSFIKKRETFNSFIKSFNLDKKSMTKEKNLFIFNNRKILISCSVASMNINILKRIQNFFYLPITVLDIPNQSIPIKTFIDVSVFIQYKLWWSFNNEKFLWLRLYQKYLIQQQKTGISKSKILKTFKLNIDNVIPIVKSKIKNLPYFFMGILQIIYFRFFYIVSQFSMMFKNKYGFFLKNQTKLTGKTSIQQNYNSVNDLGREILMSKAVTDFRLSLFFENSKDNINETHDTDFLTSLKNQNFTQTLPKNFISNFHIKYENMFFKSNRSLLFCIGDFDYKTDLEKNCDIILVKTKCWNKKQTKKIMQFKSTNSINHKKISNNYLNTETIKNIIFKSQFQSFSNLIPVVTAFLEDSSKIWKDSEEDAIAIKNVSINTTMLTKYNEIYRLKKIKLKQFFFNLHPLTSIMLKRWLEVTKSNKLKQHLKVPFINIDLSNNYHLNDKKTRIKKWNLSTPSNLKENHDFINVNLKEQFNFPLYQKNKSNFSVSQSFWFSNFNLKSLDNEKIHNLYSAALLVPTNISLSKNKLEWLKTLTANSFLSTYEFYLFKKLSTNSSLNIRCLQINPNLNFLKKNIDIFGLVKQTKDSSVFSNKPKILEAVKFSNIPLLQTGHRLKKIPRKTLTSNTHNLFQNPYKFKCFNAQVNELEMKNNIIVLKNLVSGSGCRFKRLQAAPISFVPKETKCSLFSLKRNDLGKAITPLVDPRNPNKKKEYNFIETRESYFQKYKMCRLDLTFFLLIFYTIFFEKIQHKKITLNTIKIFMPYKSLIFSHFLLSKADIYGFSCKNFEILIYNKFKNFLCGSVRPDL